MKAPRRSVLSVLSLAALFAGAPARAASPETGSHLIGSGDAIVRVAPEGVALLAGLRYKYVSRFNEEQQYEVSYFELGAAVLACPAYVEPGLHVEVLPLPFIVLRLEGDLFKFTGVYQGLLRFPNAQSAFGDAQLDAMEGQEQSSWAERGAATATLRGQLGHFIARSETTVATYHFENMGPYLYESEYDTLLARTDGLVDNRSQLFYEAYRGSRDAVLLVGPAYEVTRTFASSLNRERAGAIVVYVPSDAWGGFRRPHLLAYGGVNITDPNRTGMPFGLIALGFEVE